MTSLHSKYGRFVTALFTFTMLMMFSAPGYSRICFNPYGAPKGFQKPGAGYFVRNGYVYHANYYPVFNEAATWTGPGKDDYNKSKGISIVEGADAGTFREVLNDKAEGVCKYGEIKFSVYGRDDSHVFFNANIILGANPATFEPFDEYYAKDDTNVFFQGKKLNDAISSDFQSLDYGIAKDKTSVFYWGSHIEVTDPNSYQPIGSTYGKDRVHVYYIRPPKSSVIEGADPQSFRELKDGFSRDAGHIFHEDNRVPTVVKGADPVSFEVLSGRYAKDKKFVYFALYRNPMSTVIVKGANPRTFKERVKGSYSRDGRNWFFDERMIPVSDLDLIPGHPQFAITKTHAYYEGEPIPGADLATFIVDTKNPELSRDKNHVYYGAVPIPFLPPVPSDELATSHPDFENEIETYVDQKKRVLRYAQDAKVARLKISKMGLKALKDPAALEVAMQDLLRHGNLADTDYLRRKLGLDVEIPASDVANDKWFPAIIRSSPDYLAVPFSYEVNRYKNASTITIKLNLQILGSLNRWGRDWELPVEFGEASEGGGGYTTLTWPGKEAIRLTEFHDLEITQQISGHFSFRTSSAHHIDSGDSLAQAAAEILGSDDLRDYQKVAKSLHTEMFAQADRIYTWYGHLISNEKLIPGTIASQISYFVKDSEWNAMSIFNVAASSLSDRTVDMELPIDLRLICLSPERIGKWLDREAVRYELVPLKNEEIAFSTKGNNDISLHAQIVHGCASSLNFRQKTDVAHSPATFAMYDLDSSLGTGGNALNPTVLAKIDTLVSHLQVPKLAAIDIFEHLPLGVSEETHARADELASRIRDALTSRGLSAIPIKLHGPEEHFATNYAFTEESAVGVDATLER